MKIFFEIYQCDMKGCYHIKGSFKNERSNDWAINGGEFDWKGYDCPERLFKLIDWKLKTV
jgi:hypothetical protein